MIALQFEWIGQAYEKRLAGLSSMAAELGHSDLVGKFPSSKPWVAKIVGKDGKFWFRREFVRPNTDYSAANSLGSRGAVLSFFLDDGLYEAFAKTSWRKSRRWYFKVEGNSTTELTKEEVEKCLSSRKHRR